MLLCSLTVMMTTILILVMKNLLTCFLKLTIVTHSQFMSTVTVSMQVTITTPQLDCSIYRDVYLMVIMVTGL